MQEDFERFDVDAEALNEAVQRHCTAQLSAVEAMV
jgi:hypothetical protein